MQSHEEGSTEQQRIDFSPVPIDRLIGAAELIVIGSVEDVNEDWFELRIEEVLSHQDMTGIIQVMKAAPSEFFSPRVTPFIRGQRFTLFLSKAEKSSGGQLWRIIGLPNAGEMPVDDEHAYVDSYDLEGFDYSEREVHGVMRNIQRLDLNAFKDAVTGYRRCFSWSLQKRIKNDKVRTRWVPSIVCDQAAVRDYRGKGRMHEYLAQKTLRQIPTGSDQQ